MSSQPAVSYQQATDPGCSLAIQRQLAKRLPEAGWVIANRNADPSVLATLAERCDPANVAWPKFGEQDHAGGGRILLGSIGHHPKASAATLAKLAEHSHPPVRLAVAENPNTSPRLLWKLASDEVYWVRSSVARHPRAERALLKSLATDPHRTVRIAVAKHPKTSGALLKLLANDSDEDVVLELLTRTNLPRTILLHLIERRLGQPVRRAIALHPRCTHAMAIRLLEDTEDNNHLEMLISAIFM
jgi:hypothetical protein